MHRFYTAILASTESDIEICCYLFFNINQLHCTVISLVFFNINGQHSSVGPVRYPCGVCGNGVQNSQKALLCDSCDLWFHTRCVRVSDANYADYCSLVNFNWICTLCLFRQLPSAVTCDDSTNTTNNMDTISDLLFARDIIASPVSGVRVIHHNLQGLMSKITVISDWLHGRDRDHVVFCCSETWLKPCNVVPPIPGFKLFCSPALTQLAADSLLPGSAILVSDVLKPEHPDICNAVEKSCSVLNVACCFVTCKVHRIAIVSVYRSLPLPLLIFLLILIV